METETDFTNKVSDKLLRSKCEKLEIENPNDANALKIVLGQAALTQKQREWLQILCDRRGKKFIFLGDKQSAKPDKKTATSAAKSGDAPLNSKK